MIDYLRSFVSQISNVPPIGQDPKNDGENGLCENCQTINPVRFVGGQRPWECSKCEYPYTTFRPDLEGAI